MGILEILLWILGILVSDYRKHLPKKCKVFLLYIPKKRRIHATISATTIQKPTTIRQATFRKVCDYQSRLLRLFRRVDTTIPRLFHDYCLRLFGNPLRLFHRPSATISGRSYDYPTTIPVRLCDYSAGWLLSTLAALSGWRPACPASRSACLSGPLALRSTSSVWGLTRCAGTSRSRADTPPPAQVLALASQQH